ncbi:MAG: hypothetical protein ABR973_18435, partial [Candidatus Acidiferrales bacterium]
EVDLSHRNDRDSRAPPNLARIFALLRSSCKTDAKRNADPEWLNSLQKGGQMTAMNWIRKRRYRRLYPLRRFAELIRGSRRMPPEFLPRAVGERRAKEITLNS